MPAVLCGFDSGAGSGDLPGVSEETNCMIGGKTMNVPCDLILDLLPLYQRGLCSENSEMIITEHLTGCDACYEILSKMDEKVDVPRYEQ
ncbi:MAG: zf-HC2 domain-containing protein, partial [Oscillospiraceae bacterium]|nr:zf-HC2 domain-containing protein [Oscillospiraceae bacterium]